MSKVKQNLGVHTYAVGMTLTAAQSYEIKDGLGDFLRKSDGNYWSRSEHYTVDAFREQGVWLYLARMDTIYRVKIRIEPCRVLASGDPTALFQADKKQYREMVKQVDSLLQPCGLPAFDRPDENQSDGFDVRFDLSGGGSGAAIHPHFAEIVCLTPLQAGLFSGRGRQSEKCKRGE